MTLEKAIELNVASANSLLKHKFDDHSKAVLLGNEAIKMLINNRKVSTNPLHIPLIGETKE